MVQAEARPCFGAVYLPRLPQFRGSWQGQADHGNAVGTGKGEDNYREYYLLSVTKLLRIFQSVRHLPVAEDFFYKEKDR